MEAAAVDVLLHRQEVLHLLVEPDGDEGTEVDVLVEVADEHLRRVERGELRQADVPQVLEQAVGQELGLELLPRDIAGQHPAVALQALEVPLIQHLVAHLWPPTIVAPVRHGPLSPSLLRRSAAFLRRC